MSDNRADPDAEEIVLADEDRLPWLEAVEEDDDGRDGPSAFKLVAALVIGLIAIGVIVGGLYWLGNRSQADENQIITAEKGDYKQRPENPGGMNLSGEGNTSVAASEGNTPRGNLNVNGVAEQPAAPAQPARPTQQAPAPAPQPARPAPAPQQPQRPAPAPSGPAIQLGAFSTPAAANNAWRALAGRFRYLAPLSHHLVAVQSGGRTLHRLRASGPDSANVCRRLQAAGEACTIVN
ncbi:MAG TPA: SPOR domain-containing protein [Allosphingosinicella sp.]|nr:SPOR domain-containing protein [Allosphingosinicella sp.]